jgi:hypothetical protein
VTVVKTRHTLRPRHGRRFEPTHELELWPDALSACRALPTAHKGSTVVAEMTGPIGIPDLTALVGPDELLAARLASPIRPLLHEVDAAVVGVAHPRLARTPQQFAAALGWPEETVRRRLVQLTRSGALLVVDRNRFRRDPVLQPLGRLYAVEAKVRDWRRALQQARSYSTWADSYVLVMGALSQGPLEQLTAEVAADRAGLVVDGRWVRRPTVHKLSPGRRLWAAEHLVAALRP